MAKKTSFGVEVLVGAKNRTKGVFGAVGRGLKSLDSTASRVGVAIAGYFSARAFVGAIQGAANLEQQLDRVASVSGDYAARIDDVTKASKELGSTTAFTGKQAAEGFEEFARAGIDVDTAIASMGDTLALATAESLELGQAADIVTGNLKLWGDAGEDAASVTDKIKAGASNSRTSVEQLNRAMIDAGPVAKAMGLSMAETVAILGKFADAGFRGERGGTAVKIILSQLEDPASNARKALQALGFAGDDLVGALAAMEKAGPKADAAIRAFGTEAGPALRAVLGQGVASIGELTDKIENSEGAAKAAAAVMQGNLNGALTRLGSAWDGLKTALTSPLLEPLAEQVLVLAKRFQDWVEDGTIGRIGQALKNTFEGAVNDVKAFVHSFDFQEVTQGIQAFAAQVGEALRGLRENFTAFTSTSSALLTGVTAAWNLFTAGVKGAASVIVAALALVTVPIELALEGLNKLGGVSDETLKRFQTMRGGLKEVAAAFSKAANVDIKEMGAALAGVSSEADKTTEALDKTQPSAISAADGITTIGTAASITADELDQLTAQGQEYGTETAAAAEKAAKGVEDGATLIQKAGKAITGTFNVIRFEGWKTSDEVNQAFARMGIQSADELTALAEQARKDFEAIRLSGKATAAGIQQAAQQYLDAWKAAHDGVLPRLQDMTAAHGDLYLAILEVRKAEELKAEAAQRAADLGVTSVGREIAAQRELQQTLTGTAAAYEQANNARGGFSGSGGTISTGAFERVQATGDAQAIAEFNAFLDSGKSFTTLERQLDATNAAAEKAIKGAERRAKAGAAGVSGVSAPAASAVPSSTVRLVFGSSGQHTADVSGDADQLVAELDQLSNRSAL